MILIILLTLPSFPRNPIPIQPAKAEEQKKTLNLIWAYHNTYSVHSVSISSDGSYIAVGANDRTREGVDVHTFGSVFLFSRDGRLLWNYSIGQYVSSVSISSDGSYIAAASEAFGNSFGNGTLFLFSRDGRLLWN
jgi:WD40 repeat protein